MMVSPPKEALIADWMVEYCDGTYRVAACAPAANSIRTTALVSEARDFRLEYLVNMGFSFLDVCCVLRNEYCGAPAPLSRSVGVLCKQMARRFEDRTPV